MLSLGTSLSVRVELLSRAPAALLVQLHSGAMRINQCLAGTQNSGALCRHLLSDRVLVLCLLSGVGCSDTEPVREIVPVTTGEPGYVQAAPLYQVMIPDSLQTAVIWDQNSPLLVNMVLEDETVLAGDTILSGTDPFFAVEMERVEMALNIAEAIGDSIVIDSLSVLLSDSSSFVFVTSPAAGSIRSLAFQEGTLQPGDTIATVTGSPPDSVYFLSPAYFHIRWPGNLPGCTVTDRGLQCYGPLPGAATSIPGTWSLQPQFIFEEGLNSFLLATAGDTIPITVIGSTDTSKIIYSVFPLDSVALTPW